MKPSQIGASIAMFVLSVIGIHGQVLEKVAISSTVLKQGATVVVGANTITKPPVRTSIDTEYLLKQLAADEYFEGNWTNSTFPADARLDFNGTGFEVDQGTNLLVSVADILTWAVTGQNTVASGTYTDDNGPGNPPFSQTEYQIVTVTYNDSNATGDLSLTVSGLATMTTKAAKPNASTGNYLQTGSIALQSGTGSGAFTTGTENVAFVITGFTMTASGSAAQNNGAGVGNGRR